MIFNLGKYNFARDHINIYKKKPKKRGVSTRHPYEKIQNPDFSTRIRGFVVLVAGAWRKRQRKRRAFSEPSGCKDWGKKTTKKHTVRVCFSVVLVAGLEPARYLYRGILRLGGAKIAVFWVTQQSAKTGQNRTKNP